MALPIDLLDAIKDVFDAENTATGRLSNVKWIDWGGGLPPLSSVEFPLILIEIDRSRHPMVRAAIGKEEAFDEIYYVAITCASYIAKTDDGEGGWKAAMREAAALWKTVLTICHEETIATKWDGLVYDASIAREEDVEFNIFPLDGQSPIAYGITGIMECRSKGRTSSSSSSSSSSST